MAGLAHHAFLHRRAIVVLSLVLAVLAGAYGSTVFDAAQPFGFSDPASESSRAYERLEKATGEQAVPGVLLLVEPRFEVSSSEGREAVADVARRLGDIDGIARAVVPEPGNGLASADDHLALVQGQLLPDVTDEAAVGERVQDAFEGDDEVVAGGPAVAAVQLNETTIEDLRRIEFFAFPFLLLISLLVFRGLVAAALPLIVGVLSIAFTLAALRALSEVMIVDIFALNVVTVLGLGLAIDYSLFMVSRYREELARSGPTGQALRDTVAPIGRMVAFSAAIVAAADGIARRLPPGLPRLDGRRLRGGRDRLGRRRPDRAAGGARGPRRAGERALTRPPARFRPAFAALGGGVATRAAQARRSSRSRSPPR